MGGPEQASVHHGYCSPHEHTGKGLIPGSTPSTATKGTHPGRTGCITLLNAYSSAVVPVGQPGPDVCVPEGTTQGPVGLTWGCVLELQPGFQNVPADFRQEHHGWSIHDAGTLRDCPQHTASRSPMWVWWALPGVPVDTAGSGGCLWTRLSLWSLVLLLQGVPEKKGTIPSTQGVTGMGGRQHSLSQSAPGVIVTAGHSCLGTSFLWRSNGAESPQGMASSGLLRSTPEVTERLSEAVVGASSTQEHSLGWQAEAPGLSPLQATAGALERVGLTGTTGR